MYTTISVAQVTRSILLLIHLYALSECSGRVQLDLELLAIKNPNCIGGPVVGITNASVLLEYRQIATQTTITQTTDSTPGWIFLADIDPNEGFNQTLEIDVNSTLSSGVQFRLLQLEHGGGVCNCWAVQRMALIVDSNTTALNFNEPNTLCGYRSDNLFFENICGRLASEARGFITRILNFNGTRGSCPGDTNTTLVSTKVPISTTGCSTQEPRM